MGYWFGGKIALDLARTGADPRTAASLRGLVDAPPMPWQRIPAAVRTFGHTRHAFPNPRARSAGLMYSETAPHRS